MPNGLAGTQCAVAACSPEARVVRGAFAASHSTTEVIARRHMGCLRRFGAYTNSRPTTATNAVDRGRTNYQSRSAISESYARPDVKLTR